MKRLNPLSLFRSAARLVGCAVRTFCLHRVRMAHPTAGLILLVLSIPSLAAESRPIATTPFLRLETGMHTAPIRRISVDAAARYVVTASDDKTARVWELATGKLLQTLRPPMGEGNEGKLFAVALSPDGQEVAVGGFTGRDYSNNFHIYFFDRATGQMTRNIAISQNVAIKHLAYSRDGQLLAAALGARKGIRVYRSRDLAEVARDSEYGADSYWLDFDAQGRLVSSCYDGYVRLYNAAFQLQHKTKLAGGSQPFTVRFAPDGQQIAVGFGDSTAVAVLSGTELSLRYAPDTQGVDNGNLGSVAWSADGQTLYAGGRYVKNDIVPLFSWSNAGHGTRQQHALSSDVIMDFQPLADGRVVYGTGDPVWGILSRDGQKLHQAETGIVDHRYSRNGGLQLSPNGAQFAYNQQGTARRFDLNQGAEISAATTTRAKTTASAFSVTDWYDNRHPQFNQQAIALRPNEFSRSLAIAADEQHLVLGAEWSLRYFDQYGKQLWEAATPSVAWAVNLSADGRFAVAAFGDGTIRWYRVSDGKEQLAFFPHADGKRWVLWTPEGFYNASADGESLIGYHLNQGDDKAGQFVSVQQLGKLFYRPDLITARLNGDETAIQTALANVGDVRKVLAEGLPPQLELVSQVQDGDSLKLSFRIKAQSGGVGAVSYRLNEVQQQNDTRDIHVGMTGLEPIEMVIPLVKGRNIIALSASNKGGTITSLPLQVEANYTPPELKKPTLYVLAVGVSKYQDAAFKLNFADKDALAVMAAMKKGGGRLFELRPENLLTLTNEQVTLDSLKKAFAQIASRAKAEDVFVFYLAGHGKTFDGRYYFIPSNAVYRNQKDFLAASLGEDELTKLLESVRAQKSVVLLDTCYAGNFNRSAGLQKWMVASRGSSLDEKFAISRLVKATGRAIFAGASDNQLALEGYKGHGFFTYALLEGLQGGAVLVKQKQVNVKGLDSFLAQRVPLLSKNRQTPVIEFTPNFTDFPISLVP